MPPIESTEARVNFTVKTFLTICALLVTGTFSLVSVYFIIQSNQSHVAEIELHIDDIKTDFAAEEEEMKALIQDAEARVDGRLTRITNRMQEEIDELNSIREKYQLRE